MLAILSVVLAIAVPQFGDLEKRNLKLEAENVADTLRLARTAAIRETKEYRLIFDVTNGTYHTQRKIDLPRPNTWESVSQYTLNNVQFGSQVSKDGFIYFTNRGTTSTPATINLESDHYAVSLTINLGAGRVLVGEITKIN